MLLDDVFCIFMLERCQTQSQPPQMLYESGEREGSRLDRGRG